MTRHFCIALTIASTFFIGPSAANHEAEVVALFDVNSPSGGPFPSDWYTVPDHTQNTHRRVSLEAPDCAVFVSHCQDIGVINELDGFNIQPRLSIPFTGAIDPTTVTSDTLFLVSLGAIGPGQDYMPWGTVIGVDQVVWDPIANTLHVESDEALAQRTRFAVIVTRSIRDRSGARTGATDAFRRFRASLRDDYRRALLEAMQAARHAGIREEDIAVASVFTTRSTTALLEKVRDQIREATPDPADFLLGPGARRTVFSLDDVTNIIFNQQMQLGQPFTPQTLDLHAIRHTYPGVVGTLAFGKYLSPDYEVHVSECDGAPSEYIPAVGTRSGVPGVRGTNEVYFNLLLPSGPVPAAGWPVAIVGHGVNQNKNVPMLNLGSSMAKHGVASITINAVGHGFGPEGTLEVSRTVGAPVTFKAGGRGIDQNCDGAFGSTEGLRARSPRGVLFISDGFRQTATDLMQLVRVIEAGMDVDGDGRADVDPSRIYYFGSSLGGGYGTVFLGVEPNVRAGVLAAPADPVPIGPLGAAQNNRPVAGMLLGSRQPSLLNAPGINVLAGVSVSPPFFDDNMPLRDQRPLTVQLEDATTRVIQSPAINSVAGALEIQAAFENYEWVSQAGSPVAYAPHLRMAPLRGRSAKSVLYEIAKGDQSAPNPTTTAILRAGRLADRCVYYRHDLAWLARSEFPGLPKNPHTFISLANFGPIALTAQTYAGAFFASDGNIEPEPSRFFEFPMRGPLPEDLNFVR
jgi:hypothetical protein